jgi:hypothetical protein
MFNLKAPLFKGGWGGSNAIKKPTFPPILIKATIPLNVLLYNMFNLKAPLFKQGVFILQNCDRQNVFTINVWAGF